MEHDKWLKKYRLLLIHAWRHGLDDHMAAEKVGITYEEYQQHLAMDERLRKQRDKYVDELLKIAEESIGDKIRAGDRQACEWYLEHRHPAYGAKFKYETNEEEDSFAEKQKSIQADIKKFMDKFKSTDDLFEGN